jgi:hypothetical protein
MPRNSEDIERLIAELESDLLDLAEVESRHNRACARIDAGASDELDWSALGYTIHNVYGVIESYCLRIAKFFENSLDPTSWHRDLLGRMTLDIRGVRPALFVRGVTEPIEELRAFRHVFRNLYARRLDPAKVEAARRHVAQALAVVRSSHAPFCDALRKIAGDV